MSSTKRNMIRNMQLRGLDDDDNDVVSDEDEEE
jgi:hypothetical protein